MATPMKEASGKIRRVTIQDQSLPETIPVKLYRLNAELAAPFLRAGQFSFRVAFDRLLADNKIKIMQRSQCPVITINPDSILQTENETAQRMIEKFIVPTKTVRNGETRAAGNLFVDVTATENEYDIDLDVIFDGV
jgi:hypothetical protein